MPMFKSNIEVKRSSKIHDHWARVGVGGPGEGVT